MRHFQPVTDRAVGYALRAASCAGIVQRRWVWLLLFSPLWGSLFINFGLGPIVSRTSDLLPLAGNTAAFLASAAAPGLLQKLWDGEQPGDGQST